jgi:hypothetical protein
MRVCLSLATLTTVAVTAVGSPIVPGDALQPWLLTTLYTHSPSGRPNSSPYHTLNLTIYDPNTIDNYQPVTTNCSLQWLSGTPYEIETPCTEFKQGTWSFKLQQGTNETGWSSVDNFNLTFTLVRHADQPMQKEGVEFVGGAHFQVGQNLNGTCAASGFCNWGLKINPFPITQSMVKA